MARKHLTAIERIPEAKRLEAVLFQFSYSFGYTDDNRWYLDKLLKTHNGVPLAVEFRKADWYGGKVIKSMKSRAIWTYPFFV